MEAVNIRMMDLASGLLKRLCVNRQRAGMLTGISAVLTILLLTFLANPAQAGYAAIVIDANTGQVLHSRNADTPNFPASLTKIMTLFMAFEALDNGTLALHQPLRVSKRAAGQAPSKLGLKAGETITVDDALRALAVKSANDVATVIAEALGGTEVKFAQMMTKRARELGMSRTTFRNASGLPNKRQKSTARDMALLARVLIDGLPDYYGYFSVPSFKYKGKKYSNHNSLLKNYAGTDGIKTGYIRASGFNLVASTERDGVRLIGVVFGGKTAVRRDRQMQKLLNSSWSQALAATTIAARPIPKPEVPGDQPVASVAYINTPTINTPIPPKPEVSDDQPVAAVASINTPTISTPIPPTVVSRTPANWGIQIGAFGGYTDAHIAAGNVAKSLFNLPATASLKIGPVDQTADTLFRARLMGMDEVGARNSCQQLVSNGQECVLVTPQGDELASR